MSEEVWWIRKSGLAYYQYYDRAVAEAERDCTPLDFCCIFSPDEWSDMAGPRMEPGEIIAIRPLRIEIVEGK